MPGRFKPKSMGGKAEMFGLKKSRGKKQNEKCWRKKREMRAGRDVPVPDPDVTYRRDTFISSGGYVRLREGRYEEKTLTGRKFLYNST